MFKRLLTAMGILLGAAIGLFGTLTFRHILEPNAAFINSHKPLVLIVGTIGLLFFSKVVYDTRISNARSYGVLLLGLGCGIFIQAILYFRNSCSGDCTTDFLLKLGVCVIFMVDGFAHFYRNPV